ncbi:MAG: hypothetical protein ACJAYK_003084, partial [Crocinitomicaceae bacterium]
YVFKQLILYIHIPVRQRKIVINEKSLIFQREIVA